MKALMEVRITVVRLPFSSRLFKHKKQKRLDGLLGAFTHILFIFCYYTFSQKENMVLLNVAE
jgi:hypothetical protein